MADKDGVSYRRSAVVTPKTTTQFNQFLPTKDKASVYVPTPLKKKRAQCNNEGRRSWTSPYTEDDAPLTRQDQGQESIEGSKSTSDILVEQSVARQVRYEELQKYRESIKESDDKWQDDLSKWKSRRKSVNSDIVKKKEEREKIEEITYSGNRRSKTFKEMQEERENRRQSVGSRLGSLSFADDEDVFDKPVTTPRAHYTRSYTIDSYYSSSTYPESLKEAEPRAASPATGNASSPISSQKTVDTSSEVTIKSTSLSQYQRPPSPPVAPQRSSLPPERTSSVETVKTTSITTSSLNSIQRVPEAKTPLLASQTEAPSSDSHYEPPPKHQHIPMEPKPPVVSRVSASLPRNYQRSDSARLTSITPRPFGCQASRISSLQRSATTDDSHNKRVNGDLDTSKKSSVPSRYHQFMTSEDEAQSSSAHSSEEEEEEEEQRTEKSITQIIPTEIKSETTVSSTSLKDNQKNYCEMRISLNQKPNSSRDFGFQADWDSTGARVTTIAPGSPAEMCQLQAGDEVLSVNGHQVAGMSYTAWKSHLEEALQEGSLVMDIRRHGQNNWDRDQPFLPYKSHKTINLTSTDHPILLGSPDTKTVNSDLDFTSLISTKTEPVKEAITHPAVDVASNGVNGSFREEPVTMRNKESEPISLKNLKRRSEFFEQGGTEPAMPDIPVPSITTSSSRWSWDPEEERRRQEKWQKEQERLLQEKYKRDQEKLQEEWFKAQQDITGTLEPASLEVKSQSASPHSPMSPAGQPLSSLWEEQERKKKEELERQRQAEEKELQRLREERQKREQQQEEEERKRREEQLKKEQQEEEERKRREEQQRREQQEEEERKRREERLKREQQQEEQMRRRREEALEQQRREKERALEIQQQQWAKSKSSPQLDEEDRPQYKVVGSTVAQKGQMSVSQAELERQQLLKEMKKKTPLLTDSSWIRQRSSTTSSTSRETEVPPMRRGESLDNLDSTNYNSWRSSWTPRSNVQIPHYSRPQSALSGSTSFSGGWSGAQTRSSTLPSSSSLGSLRGGVGNPSAPWSRQTPSPSLSSPSPTTSPEPMQESQQRSRSVSGKKICTYCDCPLGKGAAMIIESLGLCYHLSCFKCFDCGKDLGGSEAGAEVRIRNKQLYCNSCYMRFKTGQPTSM